MSKGKGQRAKGKGKVAERRGRPTLAKVRSGGPSQVEGQRSKVKGRKSPGLSHVDAQGAVRMVDVGDKPVTTREAVARGRITMSRAALRLVRSGRVAKGDPLQAARLAGIMAAKRTSEIIPLCHPLPLTFIGVDLIDRRDGYDIEATVRTSSQTGVEMEALTAVAAAALTIYDMIKAVDLAREMVIGEIRLMKKSGGRSGTFRRS